MDRVRIGLIGIGRWAVDVHIANLKRLPNAAVVALCSRSEENRARGAEAVGGAPRLFASAEELLACDEVDAVIVSTPNNSHARLSTAALRAGRHVYCEKPMAVSVAEAQGVAEAVDAAGKVFMTGFELRYSDVAQTIRRLIAEGAVGRPRVLVTGTSRPWFFRGGWRFDPEISGGIFAEMTSHYTDLVTYLAGVPPLYISAMTSHPEDPRRSPDTTVAIEFEGKTVGSVSMILGAVGSKAKTIPVEVIGEEGHIVGEIGDGIVHLFKQPDTPPIDCSPERPSPYEVHGFPGSLEILAAFCASIQEGAANFCGPRDGLLAARIAEAGAASAGTHTIVPIERQ